MRSRLRTHRHLLEYAGTDGLAVIRGVKVLGQQSLNKRRYTPEAIRKALRLYEGVPVNCNHPDPKNPRKPRSVDDRLGKIVNVRMVEGELYGDLVLLKAHPMSKRLLEAAANKTLSDLYQLSHNAYGSGETDRQGVYVVTEIAEVQSVDLVLDGATNRSLFESRRRTVKLRQFLESLAENPGWTRKARRALLLEMGEMDDDMQDDTDVPLPEDDDPAAAADPMAALKSGFEQAGTAILQDESMSVQEKISKLKELLKAQEKLMGASTQEEYDEAEDRVEDEDPMKESSIFPGDPQNKVKGGNADNKTGMKESRELCELAGVRPDQHLLESLSYMPRSAQIGHIKWLKEHQGRGRFTTGNAVTPDAGLPRKPEDIRR